MPVKGDNVTLSTSPTLIWTATYSASVNHPEQITVQNNTTTVCTLGGSDVANGSKGIKFFTGTSGTTDYSSGEDYSSSFDYDGETTVAGDTHIFGPILLTQPLEKLYAIAASGTPSISIMIIGV